jgi:gliding motility-associated-like protein
VQNNCSAHTTRARRSCKASTLLLLVHLVFAMSQSPLLAQCPPNIDFEDGTFNGWTCYIGAVAAVGDENVISIYPSGGPMPGRHTIFPSATSAGIDPYGGFPINCPNGSGYSIRLGNDMGGGEAEGISYEFTIPAGRDVYNLIYHYAVVFQDPDHRENEQPRMQIEIMNVTDNVKIDCSSFSFHPFGSILPGFELSTANIGDTPVWFKNWSAVSINLNGHAGKTIRLYFKTADCTFRRHFGYAYIDVNSECSDEFVGATFCPDDTAVYVTGPYGYQNYTWFNNTFTSTLGNAQTLTLNPAPASGTTVAVEVIPYAGYGCLDTLYAKLIDTLTLQAHAGPDKLSCNETPVQIGGNSKPGVVYRWDPPDGLSSPDISNPLASPSATTRYILSITSLGGGCLSKDTVNVTASIINNDIDLIGKPSYCITSGDSAVLQVQPTARIQWYKDGRAITGATATRYRCTQSGVYYAELHNADGCSSQTEPQTIFIDVPRKGIRYEDEYAVINLPLPIKARAFGETVLWSPATYLNDATSYTPQFKGPVDQTYLINITTASGCLTVDTLDVKTIKSVEIYVPTAFTPNNDGLNDNLRPLLRGVRQLNYFRIYNRWGQVIYETRNDKPGWNGILKGMPQPTQVVVWMAEGVGVDGQIHRRQGYSTLVR